MEQFMSVCVETQEHDDRLLELCGWTNDKDEANAAGKAHELGTHGHRWDVVSRS